jgi:hypothetical protein
MITIRNGTDEDYVIQFHVDPLARGCRVLQAPKDSALPAGEGLVLLGYEPGVSFTLCPVNNDDLPRETL